MSRLESHIADHDIFEGLTEADVALFGDRLGTATFAKGELVYSPFDSGDAVYLVTDGRVCLYRSGADGRQFTLAMVDAGSAFGHVALLHAPTYDAYAEAMTETVVRVIRVDDLERVVARSSPGGGQSAAGTGGSACTRPRISWRHWRLTGSPSDWPPSCWS